MHELDRYEPLGGQQGEVGSTYRLVPKEGDLVFVATVVYRRHPSEVRLVLDAPSVTVAVTTTFTALPGDQTLLASEETFTFKTRRDRLLGFLARPAIAKAHKRHIHAFKQFAESRL
jgi:hypothetical protein